MYNAVMSVSDLVYAHLLLSLALSWGAARIIETPG